jgi:hypothetical protein
MLRYPGSGQSVSLARAWQWVKTDGRNHKDWYRHVIAAVMECVHGPALGLLCPA